MSRQVVLVHGAWVSSVTMLLLARRLRASGFETHSFDYKTRLEDLSTLAERLYRFLASRGASEPHLVGHSYGGLLVLEMLACHAETPVGRIVLLGTPARGSKVARSLATTALGRWFLGESERALTAGRDQPVVAETGVIAGNRPLGLGQLVQKFGESNDGTVAVSETRLESPKASFEVPVTHTGLLISRAVADQTARFLRTGEFDDG
jgi:pimeloyl-ACP methyl ester carboxylesterase